MTAEKRPEYESHESYGMLRFSRISHGGDTVLFGSSIPHRNTIRLAISPGEIKRDLNTDWFHATGKNYIEIEMSQSQFAEAISSMNAGSGVPVTIRRLNGMGVAEPEFTSKRMQFEEEFKYKMQMLEKRLRHLTENTEDILRNKKSITKGDRETIVKELSALKMEIASNIPFVASMYNEQLDKTTMEAKGEIEAFTANKMNLFALSKINELQALTNQDETGQSQLETGFTDVPRIENSF